MPAESRELIFPLKGISEGWSFGRQPEATCPDAQNVIPIDALGSRIRGGQRWGLSKYYAAQHNGSEALQRISSIAESITPGSSSDGFTQGDGVLSDTKWYPLEASGAFMAYFSVSATEPLVASNAISRTTAEGSNTSTAGIYKVCGNTLPNYEVTGEVTLTVGAANAQASAGLIIRAATSFPIHNYDDMVWCKVKIYQYATFYELRAYIDAVSQGSITMTPGSGDYLDPTWWQTARTLKVSVSGDTISLYVEDTLLGTGTVTRLSTNTAVGFAASATNIYTAAVTIDDFQITDVSQSWRDYRITAISGGDIYTGRPSETLTLATNGTNAVATSGRVDAQPAYGKTYFCDGTASGYKVLDNATDTVSAWTPTGGSLPVGTVDATKACRMITLYRGRIVMAGLVEYPHNWYMSKVNDPLDWDYGATTSAIMAVAGNNTDAGECPDIITCLAPYSDDLMYIGGDHTLWVMTGDPADRGRIDNISEQIGVAGPDAWAFDANGIFYFFGMGTIWKMVPGGVPEPISRNRLDTTFAAIDLVTNTVHLHWDNVRHGLFIFVVPRAEGAATHYYWDQQSDSFWKIVFPNTMGPSTAYPYDGDNPNDNALLLGGWDGYIRQIDASAVNDDGTAISSYIKYPPIAVGGPERNTRIGRILSILDSNSDNVTLTAYAEDTVQRAIQSATIRYIHTLGAGRTTVLKRVAGNAIMLMLSNSTLSKTWAIENLVVNIEAIGRTRKNQL